MKDSSNLVGPMVKECMITNLSSIEENLKTIKNMEKAFKKVMMESIFSKGHSSMTRNNQEPSDMGKLPMREGFWIIYTMGMEN